MNTVVLSAKDPLTMKRAVEILQMGGLVAFPTDTVYGVGALAFNKQAVESIYAAKDRPVEKAIPVLIADADDLEKVCAKVPEIALKLGARFWPGPLTVVVPKHPGLPPGISSGPTVGVRIPDHPVARSLLRIAGPMAVTSANLSGKSNPRSAQEVHDQLSGRIALIIDGGRTPGGVPSTVVDCTGLEAKVLRDGPISMDEVMAITGQID